MKIVETITKICLTDVLWNINDNDITSKTHVTIPAGKRVYQLSETSKNFTSMLQYANFMILHSHC